MKLLIVAHYGQQPPQNTMRRYHYWGRELVKKGYDVSILAASTLHNTSFDYIDAIGTDHSVFEGVKYYYIKTSAYSSNDVGRIKNMLEFCVGTRRYRDIKPDVIICGEAYLFGFIKRFFKNTPIIIDTADLWPQSIVEYAGISAKNPLIQYLYYVEKKAYIHSDALIFSMEGGVDYLKERRYTARIDYNKVFHINMGCDIQQKDRELEESKTDLDWNNAGFNLVYCGSIRQANQVQQICDAAKILLEKGYTNIAFRIYGNGTDLAMLQRYIVENDISNVYFYGRIEKEKIPFILSHADANILTYKQVPLMKYGGSQSKLFDYLASGKPILCNAKFGYNLIERYHCGVVTESQSPEDFAKAVLYLANLDKNEMVQMGKNGRKVAELYDQPQLVDKLCEVIDFVVK